MVYGDKFSMLILMSLRYFEHYEIDMLYYYIYVSKLKFLYKCTESLEFFVHFLKTHKKFNCVTIYKQ